MTARTQPFEREPVERRDDKPPAPTPCPHRADVRDCDEWACVNASVAALRAQTREAPR